MGKLFGTNGVRGIFSEDFNLEFIHDLVLSIGTYFGHGTILVGYDGRNSSPLIAKIVCFLTCPWITKSQRQFCF